MSDFRIKLSLCLLLLSILIPFNSFANQPSNEVGHYVFGQMRHFGPKFDVPNVVHGLDNGNNSANRYYPSVSKHMFSYLKNNSRTIKEIISYGDWDKPYRLITGFEYDYKRNKASKSNYGYEDRSGSLFMMGDKAYYNNYLRLGGGVVLTHYDSDYDDYHWQEDNNAELVAYAIYNDAPNQIRLRSRAYLGYGRTKLNRQALIDTSGAARFRDDFSNYFYGFENSLSQTYQKNIFFFQPQIELNTLGLKRGDISENGYQDSALEMKDNDLFLVEGVLDLYLGIKGKDAFGNTYNLKAGPCFTRILSDPYDSFTSYEKTSGDYISFKSRYDKRDYVTWKTYANYTFENGLGLYGELRYYQKDEDSFAWGLGINYRF